jgi:hypothetical protein
MAEQPGKLKKEHFVSKVVTDPKQPPDTLLLMGYVGESSEEGYTRLYFDAQLSVYVEIPNTAILHIQEIPVEQSVLGESYVWIQKDAELVHGKVGPNRVKAKFLEGPIVQEFMRGSQLGVAGMGQPMPQFGGPVPQPGVQASFGYCPSVNFPCPQISVNQLCVSQNIPCQIHSVNIPCITVQFCRTVSPPCPQQPQGGWGVSEACIPGQEGTIWQGGVGQFGGVAMGQQAPQLRAMGASQACPTLLTACPILTVCQPCLTQDCPTLACPTIACPTRICPSQACPSQACPTLACPTLACPTLACPSLACPSQTCPTLACPSQTCPTLACPTIACPTLACPSLACHQ